MTNTLEGKTDQQLITRVPVLRRISSTNVIYREGDETGAYVASRLFPNGYNPEAHAYDNLDAVLAELDRRGVRAA